MPIGQNQEARNRYLQAVEMRDRNPQMPFTSMATLLGYQRASNARHAWIQGLRILGRENEIPPTRQVRVRTPHGTATLVIEDLEGFNPPAGYTFGVEIETVALTRTECAHLLTTNGHEAFDESYNHNTRTYWKIVNDSSLTHRRGTAEVVSPVLRGQAGANALRSVMKVLRDGGAKTNSSCGMHTHIGVDHLTDQVKADIIRQHHVWTPAFQSLILDRRINCTYSHQPTWPTAEEQARHFEQDGATWASQRQLHRYYNLNIASYHKYGTFEFRMHHGSVNGKNASAWVALHVAFCEAVNRGLLNHTHADLLDTISDAEIVQETGNLASAWRQHYVRTMQGQGVAVPRWAQVRIMNQLLAILEGNGLLTQECASYLRNRAGNLPTNAYNTNC